MHRYTGTEASAEADHPLDQGSHGNQCIYLEKKVVGVKLRRDLKGNGALLLLLVQVDLGLDSKAQPCSRGPGSPNTQLSWATLSGHTH